MNIYRESMTRVVIAPWIVRVWRQEKDLAVDPENDDIFIAATEAARTKWATSLAIALSLLKLERVNAVEVLKDGQGEVLYRCDEINSRGTKG